MTSQASTPDEPRREGGTEPRAPSRRRRLTARLDENASVGDLAGQLPLTLTFRDPDGVEKTAPLPRKLPVEGLPPATIP